MKKRCQAFPGVVSSFLNYLAASRWLQKTIERIYVVPFLSVALVSSNVMRQSSRQVLVVGGCGRGRAKEKAMWSSGACLGPYPLSPSTRLQKERVT